MGFLMIISLVLALMALVGGPIATVMLLFRRKWLLATIAFAMFGLCSYLLYTQPVEWPFAPMHIPAYLLAIITFRVTLNRTENIRIRKADA
ncbi:MAG: hypothetical protein ABIS45_05440 [Burkholderiales bacterium]